jgi:hemoglobin
MITNPEALTDDALSSFLDMFYAKVRRDPELGHVFAATIPDGDWPAHLQTIEDFWSTVLFKTGRYKGNPFGAHVGKGIRPEHFARWLALFEQTARERFGAADAAILTDRAYRIANSLKAGLFFRPDPPGQPPSSDA